MTAIAAAIAMFGVLVAVLFVVPWLFSEGGQRKTLRRIKRQRSGYRKRDPLKREKGATQRGE